MKRPTQKRDFIFFHPIPELGCKGRRLTEEERRARRLAVANGPKRGQLMLSNTVSHGVIKKGFFWSLC